MIDVKKVYDLCFIVSKCFDKKFTGSGIKNEIKQNQQQLAEELHKPIIRKLKKKKYIHYLKTIFVVLILQICN